MPNHIHLLWEQLAIYGKTLPKNSFEKFAAKFFINKMKANNEIELQDYAVKATDRAFNIWLMGSIGKKGNMQSNGSAKI